LNLQKRKCPIELYDTKGNTAPYSIIAGKDKNLWFTDNATDKIVKLSPGGSLSEYVVPEPGCGISIITAAQNGAWFTEYHAHKIGFIDFYGKITEFPLGGNFSPYGITVDNEQIVWFTCMTSNQICKMHGDEIAYFDLPTLACYPSFITFGYDGALWFSENQGNKIGRITKQGEITEYALPLPGSAPVGIASAKDAVWFTEIMGNRIGRIDYAGEIIEHELPTMNAKPHALAISKNGAIAFTEWGANKIGLIKPDSTIIEYDIPAPHSEPHGLVFDEQGSLWFTLESGAIGKILPESEEIQNYWIKCLDIP